MLRNFTFLIEFLIHSVRAAYTFAGDIGVFDYTRKLHRFQGTLFPYRVEKRGWVARGCLAVTH
jgi:hypothetical protein